MSARSEIALASDQAMAVEAKALSFDYDSHRALDSLTVAIPQGDLFGLLVPNGSGKSTFLSLLAGIEGTLNGSLSVLGQKPDSRLRCQIGILFQDSCLDLLMTAAETLRLHGKMFGLYGSRLSYRIGEVLEAVGLSDRAGEATGHLSGGMKRRLELARALLPSPRILLLDEPTVGLDPDAKARLWSHLMQINGEGTTLIVATNDVQEAERYLKSVAFLHQGHLVAQGSPIDLRQGLQKDSVRVEWPDLGEEQREEIANWPGVGKVTWSPPLLHVTVARAGSFVPQLFKAAADSDASSGGIKAVRIQESTLEDAYFQLVGLPVAEKE